MVLSWNYYNVFHDAVQVLFLGSHSYLHHDKNLAAFVGRSLSRGMKGMKHTTGYAE
jgi:hypothetical protein